MSPAHGTAPEFASDIGKWSPEGIASPNSPREREMVEFEVKIRPIEALAALADEIGNRIGP